NGIDRGVRERARKRAIEVFDRLKNDWWIGCEVNGHSKLVGSLGYYFEQRGGQLRGYRNMWGNAGVRFITAQWTSAEDERLVQMARSAYAKGYFRMDEFNPTTRETAISVLAVGMQPPKSCLP